MNNNIGLTAYTLNLPDLPDDFLERENYYFQIEELLKNDYNIINLQGDEDIGKSLLLSHYVRMNPEKTCSCFLSTTNNFSYSTDMFFEDTIPQLYFFLNKSNLPNNLICDKGLFQNLCTKLLRKRKFDKSLNLTFVIDGLFENDRNDILVKNLIDYLPFFDGFKFIFSGNFDYLNKFLPKNPKDIRPFNYLISPFTKYDTSIYLNDIPNITEVDKIDLYKITKGYPGKLSNIKRKILKESIKPSLFISNIDNYNDIFENEWNKIDKENDILIKIIALISLQNRIYSLTSISKILDIKIDVIKENISVLDFIYLENEEVNFVSNAHKKYFANKLIKYKAIIDEKLIQYFITEDTVEKYSELPNILSKEKKWDKILDLFTEVSIADIINSQHTLDLVQNNLDNCFNAALNVKKYGDLLRYSSLYSILKEIEDLDIWEAEIEARVAMREYEYAVTIANNCELKEDRFRLFVIISKRMKENNIKIDDALLQQIKSLYNQINILNFGEKAVDLAADLLYTIPELALDLVEKTSNGKEDQNLNDWVLARLRLTAITNSEGDNEIKNNALKLIDTKFDNPKIQKMTNSMNLLFGNYTIKQVIDEIKKIDNEKSQIHLLKLWITKNYQHKEIDKILEYAIDLIVKSINRNALNANTIALLSKPLPFIKNKQIFYYILFKLETISEKAKLLGPTLDYVKLQINMFRGEINFDIKLASERLYQIYFYIDSITDITIKTECLSFLYSAIKKNEIVLLKEDSFINEIKSEFSKNIENLLETTADHFEVLEDILQAISTHDYKLALDIVQKVNTFIRRQKCYYTVFIGYLENHVSDISYNVIKEIYNKLENKILQDGLIRNLLNYLSANADKIIITENELIELAKYVNDFLYNEKKIETYIYLLKIYKYNFKTSSQVDEINNKLVETINKIDSSWDKIFNAYLIVSELSIDYPILSAKFFELADDFKNKTWMYSPTRAFAYYFIIKLAIQAFNGLLLDKSNINNDYNTLENMIKEIPSLKYRVLLWTDLAILAHLNNNHALRNIIVTDHIKPLILACEDEGIRNEMIVNSSQILFCDHNKSALDYIDKLPENYKEDALFIIIDFILTKLLPDDPRTVNEKKQKIKYEEILDIISIAELYKTDAKIYLLIKEVTVNIIENSSLDRLQIESIREKLIKLCNSKLPDFKNIKHEGFKILADAYILLLDKKRSKLKNNWELLISKIQNISNSSDKAYSYALISNIIPDIFIDLSRKCIDESIKNIELIKSLKERFVRYHDISDALYKINPSLYKTKFKELVSITNENTDDSFYSIVRDIIDISFKHDKIFAQTLIDISSKNKSYEKYKSEIKEQEELLKIKEKMLNDEILEETKNKEYSLNIAKSAWDMYGRLKSGRISNRKVENTINWLQNAFNLQFSEAYSIFICFIENAVQRHSHTNEAKTIIRPLFESILINARILKIISNTSKNNVKLNQYILLQDNHDSVIIKAGQFEDARSYLNQWVTENVKEYIKICDPYFTFKELWLIKPILSINKYCRVKILTSLHDNKLVDPNLLKEKYETEWKSISDQTMPPTSITIVWSKYNLKTPFHDRWIISDINGIKIGSSLNYLGVSKDSEITILTNENRKKVESEIIDNYLSFNEISFNGEKLEYQMFNI